MTKGTSFGQATSVGEATFGRLQVSVRWVRNIPTHVRSPETGYESSPRVGIANATKAPTAAPDKCDSSIGLNPSA